MLRTARNHDRREASRRFALPDTGPSLTIQSQKDEADINVLVQRFGVTGGIPVSQRVPLDIDIDEVIDYKSAMDFMIGAQQSFNSLPAIVRAEFQNDPAAFLDFAEKEENLPKLREWGLAPKLAVAASEEPPAGGDS